MDKNRLLDLAANPDFISGIYNYCDRWCERCPFTDRCLNYAMQEAEGETQVDQDIEKEAFWKRLEESLQVAIDLLNEMAEKEGIDLKQIDFESSTKEFEEEQARAEAHPLACTARKYSEIVDKWFKKNKRLFREREIELTQQLKIGIDKTTLKKEVAQIVDALEVIFWYQYQIYVKIMRALTGTEADKFAEENGFPRDSDGSAKVALIAIDRSIGAWRQLTDYFPEKTDDILTVLLHLDRLRKSTEAEFPNARAFLRPGFDT